MNQKRLINQQDIKVGDKVYIEYLDFKDVKDIFEVTEFNQGESYFRLNSGDYVELNMKGCDSYLKVLPDMGTDDDRIKLLCQKLLDYRVDRKQQAIALLNKYGVADTVITKVSNLTLSAGYHNEHHLYSFVMNLSRTELFKQASEKDKRLLLIAGLTHDGMHIQDKDDLNNIKSSCHLLDMLKFDLNITDSDLKEVKRLIHSTINDYRYNPQILEDVKYSGLMQDVDMMSNFDDDSILFRYGLGLELNKEINTETTITFLKLYDIKCDTNQEIFNKGIEQLEQQLSIKQRGL